MDNIKSEFDKVLKYITENSSHWIYRCPFCGDSDNQNKGHLYVSKTSPVYRCARCGSSGHYSKLISGIELPDNMKTTVKSKISGNVVYMNYTISDQEESYLQSRLGDVVIDPKVCKIITIDTLRSIYRMSSSFSESRSIPNDMVAFVTHFNKKVICRHITGDRRYDVYALTSGPDVFVLNNPISPTSFRKHKTLVIAEGIFDILNTYYNLNIFPKDSVFIAALNSNFSTAYDVGRIVTKCFEPNLCILGDADKSDEEYTKTIKSWYFKYTIYRNKAGKDFGEKQVEPYISERR